MGLGMLERWDTPLAENRTELGKSRFQGISQSETASQQHRLAGHYKDVSDIDDFRIVGIHCPGMLPVMFVSSQSETLMETSRGKVLPVMVSPFTWWAVMNGTLAVLL